MDEVDEEDPNLTLHPSVASWAGVRRTPGPCLRPAGRSMTCARHPGLAVFVGCTLLGAAIEVLQYNMKLGRHGEWTDLLSDVIGAALGVGKSWRSKGAAALIEPRQWTGRALSR